MLTGDKMETAENIGYSCSLLNEKFEVIRINLGSEKEADFYLDELKSTARRAMSKGKPVGAIVDGIALEFIMEDFERAMMYLAVLKDCESVICCRVTPNQKAQVVRLVKKYLGKCCLAIGDGGNDVNMIQQGNIGVGIFGLEGMQAANSSDFAVPEFQCLERLLFVHGRWLYLRNAELILYFFYKNLLFTIPQFFFVIMNGFSAQSQFDEWYMSFYNLFFTAFPLGIKALFDRDLHYQELRRLPNGQGAVMDYLVLKQLNPIFYHRGQVNESFTNANFVLWVLRGILHAFFIWLISTFSSQLQIIDENGRNCEFWHMSVTMFTSIYIVDPYNQNASVMLLLMCRYITILHVIVYVFLSLNLYFGWIFIEDRMAATKISHSQGQIWSSPIFYLVILANLGWLVVTETCFKLLYKSQGLHRNIEWLGKQLKKDNCMVTAEDVEKELVPSIYGAHKLTSHR
jgi:magnesium-transporting ATPase (P-type)